MRLMGLKNTLMCLFFWREARILSWMILFAWMIWGNLHSYFYIDSCTRFKIELEDCNLMWLGCNKNDPFLSWEKELKFYYFPSLFTLSKNLCWGGSFLYLILLSILRALLDSRFFFSFLSVIAVERASGTLLRYSWHSDL